ncbi:hypothetical protein GCM10011321_28250 [Youhaiella tibetensis]|uniref:Uncharacterized protein n=1 Tax=Paradevosia tibetensis TaxID=1447062 RepID=A0A5B9DIR0_9HYPH|nr:deaminase [Youhaiella tibetensis]QEE19181.1 hypothetical protein FNA67_02880 [Youhaiella tibetensis]GGF35515.1 hypothetical protein GCM10011321_28250 [Youhaiella tibetensis]
MTITESDHRNIALLSHVTADSHDPDRPVGVIIADDAGVPVAQGTNAPPSSYGYSRESTHAAISADPKWKYFMMEHAERNAILGALANGTPLQGTTLYGTLFPCADCARAIAAAGIARVVVPAPGLHPARDEKWRDHYRYARDVLALSGVAVDFYSPSEAPVPASREG